jgi:hypothetical protein
MLRRDNGLRQIENGADGAVAGIIGSGPKMASVIP